eukprot:TRINITY_DN66190_c8_g2_i1.p1 TRINITY_DN66190_c8_g2~~TRINITY_DN66190_c8_g2_i1.p1  ORF type:complete len:411 (-),score=255.75 TRINITY_DN66190_c8_g2_i1:895-2127(-)
MSSSSSSSSQAKVDENKCPVDHSQAASSSSSSSSSASSSKKQPSYERPGHDAVYYADYLGLNTLLQSQHPKTSAHDELLFITTHQISELHILQILHEVRSCCALLKDDFVDEKHLGRIVRRLDRVTKIQQLLTQQLSVLETMTPLDFLEFRDALFPASGFQSVQFRLLEIGLGLRRDRRLKYAKCEYASVLLPEHQAVVEAAEKQPSLFELVERWLERTPFLKGKDFDFWAEYKAAVHRMYDEEVDVIKRLTTLSEETKQERIADSERSRAEWTSIFEQDKYEALLKSGQRRLSYNATKAVILISLYRDEPIFQMPFALLTTLQEIDAQLTQWRNRHAIMVQRMLGMKVGTGGSSGYKYLKAAANYHKVFDDFSNLSMFLIPASRLPKLPDDIVQRLHFHYDKKSSSDTE